ncbi:Translation factor [Candidatus Phytoplasma australiense]|uniref:L-threonylcarbamoyladenylate synthase n=2 Tax=Phytoplasma australiense TaxID=59748 RepID=B1V949_PHYAS|nr:L-threonylcarbamoyladenylate synthase [Candidatus Phytoplasma australiense]AGL90801.1 Translation Factor [Strawberry lethal yellows phytoplasma (CPA) str. NZSb11]CAM11481.1 Translation factor [Candidatus Phytoplasma australiense]
MNNTKPLKNIIIFPTDTVYGMGVSLYDEKGLKEIYQLKKRSLQKNIIVLCSSLKEAQTLVKFNEISYQLATKFFPGPLTLILKTQTSYLKKTGQKTLGIRIPNHPLALSLLKKYGPLKTTSVNESGKEPLNYYNTIYQMYNNKVGFIYPNDYPILKVASTIVDATTNKLIVLRQGSISEAEIKKIAKL